MSFNWRLLLAPPEILDYVVEHEVCHLEVMDHSPRFWRLLAVARARLARALGLAAPLRLDLDALKRPPQRGVRALAGLRFDDRAAHPAGPGDDRAVAAHVEPGAHARAFELDPRRDQVAGLVAAAR